MATVSASDDGAKLAARSGRRRGGRSVTRLGTGEAYVVRLRLATQLHLQNPCTTCRMQYQYVS